MVPATNDARSSVTTLLLNKTLETFFCIILKAKPSAMADLPTPGSPIKRGLFFFLLLRICETLSISLFRPITGSILPSLAIFVKSLPKLSSTGVLDFFFLLSSDADENDETPLLLSSSGDSSGNASEVGMEVKSSSESMDINLNWSFTVS